MSAFHELKEAVYLGRPSQQTVSVALQDGLLHTIRCPFEGGYPPIEILGTRVWYGTDSHEWASFDVWELAETDGGHLVCVNINKIRETVINAKSLWKNKSLEDTADDYLDLKEKCKPGKRQEHYINIEPVLLVDEIGRGFFPSEKVKESTKRLQALRAKQKSGAKVTLYLVAAHNAIEHLFISKHINPEAYTLLKTLQADGLEIKTVQVLVSLEDLKVTSKKISVKWVG